MIFCNMRVLVKAWKPLVSKQKRVKDFCFLIPIFLQRPKQANQFSTYCWSHIFWKNRNNTGFSHWWQGNFGFSNPSRALLEREYRVKDEAKTIAGVFRNRLDISMALQSCTTVEYIITEIQKNPIPSAFWSDFGNWQLIIRIFTKVCRRHRFGNRTSCSWCGSQSWKSRFLVFSLSWWKKGIQISWKPFLNTIAKTAYSFKRAINDQGQFFSDDCWNSKTPTFDILW